MSIRLHIDRLVLDGVPLSDGGGPHVQAAIEHELSRLLSAGGVNPSLADGGTVPVIRAGDIHVAASDSHDDLGRRIAGALYGGIGSE